LAANPNSISFQLESSIKENENLALFPAHVQAPRTVVELASTKILDMHCSFGEINPNNQDGQSEFPGINKNIVY